MKLIEMNRDEVQAACGHAVALLPIAAIEQHGPHLAISTDTAIVSAVAESAESALPEHVVLCPTLPYGASHHHFGFGATMSLLPETYVQVLVDLAGSLLHSGFRRIVFLNGHGGNIAAAKHVLTILTQRYDDQYRPNIVLATYWELAGKPFSGEPPMESAALAHACEYETSLMLHLYPERVQMEKAKPIIPPPGNSYFGWENEIPNRGVTISKSTHFLSSSGSVGSPHLATADKGRKLMEEAITATIEFLDEFRTWPLLPDLR